MINNEYRNVVLYLTLNCNLGCPYCFCGKKYKQDMDIETLEKAIAFYDQVSTGRECTITFFRWRTNVKI